MTTFKQFIAEHARTPRIVSKLAHDFDAPLGAVSAFILGGDHPKMKELIDRMTKDGFDPDDGWNSNAEWFKRHDISKNDYYLALILQRDHVDLDDERGTMTRLLQLLKDGDTDEARALLELIHSEGYKYEGLGAVEKSLNASAR